MKYGIIVGWCIGLSVFLAQPVWAQRNFDAQWIWFDQGNPAESAPEGSVWFRREIRASEPSTGMIYVICDDAFEVWVNGVKVGGGDQYQPYRFNLNGIVERGLNVIAVAARNKQGKAGLFVEGEIRGQSGGQIPFDTGKDWMATLAKPEGDDWLNPQFVSEGWSAVKVLGSHAESPWKDIVLEESYLDRFDVPVGFELKRVAEPELAGSLVCTTWGRDGRLIASRQGAAIVSLIDDNQDGTFDRAVEFTTEVKNCQGLCMIRDELFCMGEGPQGPGIYRLPDRNNDAVADELIHVYTFQGGIAEHGPHDIVWGPDGWLYCNAGNHAWVKAEREPTSPLRNLYEGYLLEPKFEDAGGHAVGIKAPGGTIWRFTPDGKKWWCETAGFRNQYDVAFTSQGDLFSFDSDMEWDVGLPWYRPVRVNHCIPGAELGWRSGTAPWPEYYFDSLPGTVNVGRGSPTGVIFYEHRQFPEKYRGSFLACDWSMGRILAVHLKSEGGSFTGTSENLVTGNPLNVSDIEVDRDGSVLFTTGGRGTEGGVYRLSYTAGDHSLPPLDSVEDLVKSPQGQSNWVRDAAEKLQANDAKVWQSELESFVVKGDENERIRALSLLSLYGPKPSQKLLATVVQKDMSTNVRAFAIWLLGDHPSDETQQLLSTLLSDNDLVIRRRACEAFVRTGLEAPVEPLLSCLADNDRHLQFAARLTLERVPTEKWKSLVLQHKNPSVVTLGLLALYRLSNAEFEPNAALKIEHQILSGQLGSLTPGQMMNTLRLIQLTLLAGGNDNIIAQIGQQIRDEFPYEDDAIDTEAARLLAFMQIPGAAEKIMNSLESAPTRELQIHYALTLRYLNTGWDFELKRRYLAWYNRTRGWEGGNSLVQYLANIVGAGLERYNPDERKQLLIAWADHPFAAGLILQNSQPEQIADFEQVMTTLLDDSQHAEAKPGREEVVSVAITAMSRTQSAAARESLRKLFETVPDRRDQIARAIAQNPVPEDWALFVQALQYADLTTAQLCVNALSKIEQKPEKPEGFRWLIVAGLKLGDQGGKPTVALLEKWTGAAHDGGDSIAKALAFYQAWYAEKFPDAPAAELPQEDTEKSKYNLQQLTELANKDSGDAMRGKIAFTKGKCVKCHRFLKEGENVGPDLTSVRRRFQKKDVVESLVFPSQVISDQYRMVTIVTKSGLVHNGMPVPTAKDKDTLTLLLSDATRLEISKKEIDEQVASKTSVMPVGVLNELTPEEIADLFSFLETSRLNPLTPATPEAAGK
ncbi:MAG: HEAT repeat domain-containing protein [Planctomycetaceae bacterium]